MDTLLNRYTNRQLRPDWTFELQTADCSLWWSRSNLIDSSEYFSSMLNGGFVDISSSDLTEFSSKSVIIMLSYLDNYVKPLSINDHVDHIEECLVLSDRLLITPLKDAIINELESNDHSEYTELAKRYGIRLKRDEWNDLPFTGGSFAIYQPSGHINMSRVDDSFYPGVQLFKKVSFNINGQTIDSYDGNMLANLTHPVKEIHIMCRNIEQNQNKNYFLSLPDPDTPST